MKEKNRENFKLVVPYLAVVPCWLWLHNAWLTILVYHFLMLVCSARNLPRAWRGWNKKLFLLYALPCGLSLPVILLALPWILPQSELAAWLAEYKLEGRSLLLLVAYFGILHPVIEQAHWNTLRSKGWLAHLCFAGYHALVLYSLLPLVWVGFCVVVLALVSKLWQVLDSQERNGFFVPLLSHVFADFGMILAAFLLVNG